jgi:hypothetical protein
MDEDEDSPEEEEDLEIEDVTNKNHASLDAELLHGGGGSNGMNDDRA